MKSTHKKNLLIYKKQLMTMALTWAGCFVAFLSAYLLVLAPQNKSNKRVEKELNVAKQDYQFALKSTQEETRNQLKEEIKQLQNKMEDFIVDFEELTNLSFDISRIANERKFSSFSIKSKYNKISEIPNCKYIGESRIEINFRTNFERFTAFLSNLERHRPVVFVDGFSMSRQARGASNRSSVSIRMNVSVLVRK